VRGDLYVADAQSLKSIPANQFSTNSYGQLEMNTGEADTIINFGTKEAFFNSNTVKQITSSNINTSNLNVGPNIALTGSKFLMKESDAMTKIHAWTLGSNTISNSNNGLSSLTFSTSNNWIIGTGSLEFQDRIQANNAIVADHMISFSNGASNLKTKYTKYNSNYTASNKSSYLYQYEDALEYKTQTSQAEWGGIAPQVLQFSADSNGSVYIRSNITMPQQALVRVTKTAGLDNGYIEGRLKMTHDTLRYAQLSNDIESIWWSVNSNGMFLNEKNSIYGKLEGENNNFTRLDMTLADGMIFGRGLSNNFGTDRDFFKVSKDAEIFTADATSTMRMLVNSNAEISKGSMLIDNDGNLKVNASNVVLASGTIQRRPHPDSNTGFQVTPNGFVTIGQTSITNEGTITSINATVSNLTACNINVVSVTAVSVTESNLFCFECQCTEHYRFKHHFTDINRRTSSNNKYEFIKRTNHMEARHYKQYDHRGKHNQQHKQWCFHNNPPYTNLPINFQ
jgi:hypothetical protein